MIKSKLEMNYWYQTLKYALENQMNSIIIIIDRYYMDTIRNKSR